MQQFHNSPSLKGSWPRLNDVNAENSTTAELKMRVRNGSLQVAMSYIPIHRFIELHPYTNYYSFHACEGWKPSDFQPK